MSITWQYLTGTEEFLGKALRQRSYSAVFDSSYPALGYPVTPQTFGFQKSISAIRLRNTSGFSCPFVPVYDRTNQTLRLMVDSTAPMMQITETVTLTGNTTGTLKYVPGPILVITNSTNVLKQIPVGKTPITKEVAINLVTGGVTCLASDSFTTLTITYIPLGTGPFQAANRVIDEAVTLASAGVNLANQAGMIDYVWDSADATAPRPAIVGKSMTPATHQIQINLANSTNTTLTSNSAQNTDAALVTYWKASAFTAEYDLTAQANIATTGSNTLLSLNTFAGIAVPCFGNCWVGVVSGPTFIEEVAGGPGFTPAANKPTYDPLKGTLTLVTGDAAANIEVGYIILSPFNSQPNVIGGEMPTGTNLSAYNAHFDIQTTQG
jgi:hypothetical protein